MNVVNKNLLLASSAIMFGLALFMSQTLWPLMGIFCVPLFFLGCTKKLGVIDGFFYGFLLWGCAAFGVLWGIFNLSQGPFLLRILPPLLMLSFEALCTGLWMKGTSWLSQQSDNVAARLAIWTFAITLYFYWVIHLSLSIFSNWEGYFLMNPLLPLAEVPQLLTFLPFLEKELLIGLLIATNAFFSAPFLTIRSARSVVACFALGIAPWTLSYYSAPASTTAPSWVSTVCVVPNKYVPGAQITEMAEQMGLTIKTILKNQPTKKLIIFPESSLSGVNLSTARELGYYWSEKFIGKKVNLLIGAYCWEDNQYRNTVYWFCNGELKGQFHKRHAMPVTEQIGGWYDIPFLKNLFHSTSQAVTPSVNARPSWPLIPSQSVSPYICSELFFNNSPDDQYQNVIAALCNDYWTPTVYLRRLMMLAAQFKAYEWQRPTLYCAYEYAVFIDSNGHRTALS